MPLFVYYLSNYVHLLSLWMEISPIKQNKCVRGYSFKTKPSRQIVYQTMTYYAVIDRLSEINLF